MEWDESPKQVQLMGDTEHQSDDTSSQENLRPLRLFSDSSEVDMNKEDHSLTQVRKPTLLKEEMQCEEKEGTITQERFLLGLGERKKQTIETQDQTLHRLVKLGCRTCRIFRTYYDRLYA